MSPHSRRCVLRYVDRSIREKFVYAHVHKFRERNILRPIFGDTAGETDLSGRGCEGGSKIYQRKTGNPTEYDHV